MQVLSRSMYAKRQVDGSTCGWYAMWAFDIIFTIRYFIVRTWNPYVSMALSCSVESNPGLIIHETSHCGNLNDLLIIFCFNPADQSMECKEIVWAVVCKGVRRGHVPRCLTISKVPWQMKRRPAPLFFGCKAPASICSAYDVWGGWFLGVSRAHTILLDRRNRQVSSSSSPLAKSTVQELPCFRRG